MQSEASPESRKRVNKREPGGITQKKGRGFAPPVTPKQVTLDKLDRPAAATGHLPIAERVLDRMADIMLASDEILEMLAAEPGSGDRHAVESAVRRVYDEINEVMKTLTD